MEARYKYYLTFDVGIKNLAYCLVRKDATKDLLNSIDILYWGILDVSYKPLICKHIVNKRKICNKISQFYLLKDKNIANPHDVLDNLNGYCKSHVATGKAGPLATSPPEATHACKPPSSTATASWPHHLSIHHKRPQ